MLSEINNLNQIREDLRQDSPVEEQQKQQAIQDLRFLCGRLRLNLLNNVDYQSLFDQNNQKHADLLVVYHDMKSKKATFSSSLVRFGDDSMYVVVVAYVNGQVKDAFAFPGSEFKSPGLLSMFKHDKKGGVCGVNMDKASKLSEYSFGNAVKSIVPQG